MSDYQQAKVLHLIKIQNQVQYACSVCNELKLASEYRPKKCKICISCQKVIERTKYALRSKEISARKRENRLNNYDRYRAKEIIKTNRYKTQNPNFILASRLRARIRELLNYSGARKTSKTMDMIGCDKDAFRCHLESKFTPNMNWDRLSEIHIDHIRPVSSFDLNDPKQQAECFHYSNLQPLWATTEIARKYGDFNSVGNINKGDRLC